MLKNILLETEYRMIPENVVAKIERLLNENSENYVTTKALFETYKRNQEGEVSRLEELLRQEKDKNESINLDYELKSARLEELENKLKTLDKQNLQLKSDILWHENEARTFRLQRDEVVDEKSTLQAILSRRSTELEQLKTDYDAQSETLKQAIQLKIQALTKLDEIQSSKIELDFKEKRLDKEKELMNEQINLLSNDVAKHSKELIIMKREHTAQIIDFQNKVQLKDEEIRVLKENELNYQKQLNQMTDKIDELNARLNGQSEVENQLQQKYVQEIDSRTKLSDMYKEMSEESNRKAEELAKTSKELQNLLSEASTQYEDLERRFTINEKTYEEHLQQKNETIAALKKELVDANHLIETLKRDHLTETLETLSPHAAAAASLMRKGLTLTQIYSEYASVSEQLMIKTHDNEQLKHTFKSFVEELEGKAHILKKRNEEYAEAMETVEKISSNYEQLEMDYNVTKEKHADAERNLARLLREKEMMQKTITDLSRQVCYLLKEVEESRGGQIIMSRSLDGSGSGSSFMNSADVISKKLVTFHDIEELQENNQKLLSVVRDLSEGYEKSEAKLKEFNKEEMEDNIKQLESRLSDREEEALRQEKIIQMLKNQIKMLQMMGPADVMDGNAKRMLTCDMDATLRIKNVRDVDIQTVGADIESAICAELQKELEVTKRELAEVKNEFETSTNEHVKNERMMLDSLEKSEQSYQKLSHDYKKIISRAELSEEKCKSMQLSMDSLKTEVGALENRCRLYSQTIGKHEQSITMLRDEAMKAMASLSRTEVLLENTKRECEFLRNSEARIAAERNILKQDKIGHASLLSNLESIKASIDRSEAEWKLKMDAKLDSAMKECSALRRRLQDEQDRYNEKLTLLEQTVEMAKSRLEEEKNSSSELMNVTNSLKLDIEEKNKRIEELKEKLKNASSKSVAELELQIRSLQNKYQNALRDLDYQKELVNAAKKDTEEFRTFSDDIEKKWTSEREGYLKVQREMETKISALSGEVANLRTRNELLQKRVNELTGLNETSMVNLSDELQQEKHKYASMAEEFASMKHQLAMAQNELKMATDAKLFAEKKYTEEMLQRTHDIKTLQNKVDTIMVLENKMVTLIAERDTALKKVEAVSNNWREEETKLRHEVDLQNEKMMAVVQQNEVLLNQIEELSMKMTVSQRRDSIEGQSGDTSFESNSNMDNLLQVINYLRREKNLANSQLEVASSENRRLKSEVELFKHQLEETHLQLKAEQDKSDISSTTAAKHAELVSKVQTLNALTDSNRVLREERDRYAAELADLRERMSHLESQTVSPLREETKRLQLQVEALQTELIGINKECAMWRNRVTEMTEKTNKTNSEELKDLKKTLNKEREEYNKTLDVLRAVKQEKSKLEEQVKKLQATTAKVTQLEKEKVELTRELNTEKAKIQKLSQEFEELHKTQDEEINKHKTSIAQIKNIARKYKTQFQELSEKNTLLTDEVKQLQVMIAQKPIPSVEVTPLSTAEISADEQNRLRLEGRQQMETEMSERFRQLNDQMTTNQTVIETLEAENKTLKETVAEKDVRNADIMQQAKTRISYLTKFSKKHAKDNETKQKQIDEYTARVNVMESRISMMEKESTEIRAERDRLSREVEVLTQRLNSIQRLHTQQGVKSNVNISQEKSIAEPPTANIKPMAGPSSSVTKSQQNQQSVAVTPWRSANETPLASIRPMSMQTRTAAVLPTSQTSCSASQSTVMVPPQQQLVDTSSNAPSIVEAFSSSPSSSSHTDYNMPSTSSSVSHPALRQVVVTPTQQTSHSAESTQDVEAECVIQELTSQPSHSNQQQSSQVSQNQSAPLSTPFATTPTVSQSQMPTVALVLPRIDLQNISAAGTSLLSNTPEQSVVASSQTNILPLVSASNQTDSSSAPKRAETYYQQDNEDSNLGQVSASNQHGQQQPVVASSIETAPEQSIVIASSQQSYDKNMSEPSVASSNANSSNTVTTTQAGLKRSREMEGESSKGASNKETSSMQPQAKRSRRMEPVHADLFRNDIDDNNSTDMLLKYRGLDVEYQVPTSSQRDQEFDNLVIDSEVEDEPEEDEQTMPDDGIIDENDDGPEYGEDEEEVENEEAYENEDYDREEQDTTMTSYNIIEGPDIDEEGVQVQDQDNEVEIIDEESNEVPNQSGRSDTPTALMVGRRNLEQQSSEATSSGNNLRAQSASISSNQSSVSLQFNRRPSTISPLGRQQNQQLLLSQGFEDNAGDDSIVPSTPTLCVPRRTDGFGEAVSSPQVPSTGRFTFADNNPPTSRAGVAQMISEGMDDTRMDLSQLEENSGTDRSVPSTPLQSSPQEIERIEVGHSSEDGQQLPEECSSNPSQQQQPPEDILIDVETFRSDAADNELKVTNESQSLMDEPTDPERDGNADVTSDSGQADPAVAGTSQGSGNDIEEGREAEAATKSSECRQSPQPIPTTNQTARRGNNTGRAGRPRGIRTGQWGSNMPRNQQQMNQDNDVQGHRRGSFRDRGRKPNKWYSVRRY